MADIFISYSSMDRQRAQQLAALLETKGWSVWWDRNIPVGQSYDMVIEHELNAAKCVIVLWTKNAVASEWVKNEAGVAAKRKVLLPVLLEDVQVPLALRHLECALLIDWDEDADHPELEVLYRSINSLADASIKQSQTIHRRRMPVHYILLAALGAGMSFFALLFYYKIIKAQDLSAFEEKRLLLLAMLAAGLCLLFFGLLQSYLSWNRMKANNKLKLVSIVSGLALAILAAFVLPTPNIVFISGKVVTAAEFPISNAQVSIDGTRFYTRTLTNGLYALKLEDYKVGDNINIIVTHNDFEDKELPLKITGYKIDNFQFTLNPIPPQNRSHEKNTTD